MLIVSGTPKFWAHFYITVSNIAQELLGLASGTLAVTATALGQITRYGEGLKAGNTILASNINQTVPIFGTKCLANSLEQRISIHLESSLGIARNIGIQQTIENSNYDLANFMLSRNTVSQIDLSGTNILSTGRIQFPQYASQLVLQRRADKITQWSPMLYIGDTLRELRLRLFMMYRVYRQTASGHEYIIEKRVFPFSSENDFWTADLKFVSS
jgi:hypothetical protein